MNKEKLLRTSGGILPYIAILFSAIIAYLPVSFMIYSLKNDIIVIEYPIKYYLSECIRHGMLPFWFNSWAMGFPLDTVISWNPFNPLHLLPALAFHYNVYILHVEFVGYIFFAGCSMYYFLCRHITQDKLLALLLAICYMLSGFNVGSSQWLLYLSASGFLPLVVSSLLDLLKHPSRKASLRFVIIFYCMFTGVYGAFTVINVYIIVAILLLYFYQNHITNKEVLSPESKFIWLTGIFTIIVCSLPLYHTLTLLPYLERGVPIAGKEHFFNSNALHPEGLVSLLLPFSSVKMHSFNTEGTMMDAYGGLLPLVTLTYCIRRSIVQRNFYANLFLGASILFLAMALGPYTPVRRWANVLPGFSLFRNAGLIRLYFLFFMSAFIGKALGDSKFDTLLEDKIFRKHCQLTIAVLLLICLSVSLKCFLKNGLQLVNSSGIRGLPQSISEPDSYFISSLVQALLLLVLLYGLRKRQKKLMALVVASDVIINTLICTPFFTVSSYSVRETNKILNSVDSFPVQQISVSKVPTFVRKGSAVWYNTNVYNKLVSSRTSYWGALTFKSFVPCDSAANGFYNHPMLFTNDRSAKMTIVTQLPKEVVSDIASKGSTTVFFLQNYYPPWHAYFNGSPLTITKINNGQMAVTVHGSGRLSFKYERPFLTLYVVISNMLIIITLFAAAYQRLVYSGRRNR